MDGRLPQFIAHCFLNKNIRASATANRKLIGGASRPRQHPPRFHAATKAAREAFRKAYGLFLAAFREAAERLKAGDRRARFPNGCFPPGLPFVRA